MALEYNVMCWLLPANTLHFLQPLDEKIFANFKRTLRSMANMMMKNVAVTNRELMHMFFTIAYDAEREDLTLGVIMGSFKATGVYPFDPKRIMQLAKLNAARGLK